MVTRSTYVYAKLDYITWLKQTVLALFWIWLLNDSTQVLLDKT